MEEKGVNKKRRLTSECEIPNGQAEMIDTESYVELYESLRNKFNSTEKWIHLTSADLTCNGITTLPIELGNLPLRYLNLSQNCLGIRSETRWPWLEQSTIRKTLFSLTLSFNFLTELPWNMEKLTFLRILDVSHNKLRRLPNNFGSIPKLTILNLSHNEFVYIISTFLSLNLRYIDISINPFESKPVKYVEENFQDNTRSKILSLSLLSAKIIMEHRVSYDTSFSALTKYLERVKFCYRCKQFDIDLVPFYIIISVHKLAGNVDYTKGNESIAVECYLCSFECDESE